ncbi:hypothetical protein D3C75_703540 [compost metagenome]
MFSATVHERVNSHRHAFRVFMHQQLKTIVLRGAVTEIVHLAEFPAGINMQQWERKRAWVEGFTGQMQHHRGVFANGIHHHRISKFGCDLTDDMDAFRLQLP